MIIHCIQLDDPSTRNLEEWSYWQPPPSDHHMASLYPYHSIVRIRPRLRMCPIVTAHTYPQNYTKTSRKQKDLNSNMWAFCRGKMTLKVGWLHVVEQRCSPPVPWQQSSGLKRNHHSKNLPQEMRETIFPYLAMVFTRPLFI